MSESRRPGRSFFDYWDAGWQAGAFRTLAIAVLAASFAAGVVALLTAFSGPAVAYALPVCFLIAAGSVPLTETLARPERRSRQGPVVWLGAFVSLLIITRLLVWVHSGFPTEASLRRLLIDPLILFEGEYVAAAVVMVTGWLWATLAARDFFDLRIQADEVAARDSSTWGGSASQWRVFQPVSRAEVLGRFATRWLVGGMLVILCAATTRASVGEESGILKFALRDAGLPTYVLLAVLAYFVAGFLLISDGRLAMLRGRWYNQGVRIAPNLTRRWHALTILFLLGVALLALLLPLGPTSWLAYVIEWVMALLMRIILWVMMLVEAVVALVVMLLQGQPPPQLQQQLQQAPLPRAIPTQRQALMQLPDWLGGAVLWAVVVLLGAYLLVRFFSAGGFVNTALGRRLLKLRLWSRGRRARLSKRWRAGLSRIRARLPRRAGLRRTPRVQGGTRPATPQEEVRAYYLGVLREAADRGVARPPYETPLEYARELDSIWPETKEDVETLTGAFLEARYSRQEIDAGRASVAQALWRRLARAFARKPEPRE